MSNISFDETPLEVWLSLIPIFLIIFKLIDFYESLFENKNFEKIFVGKTSNGVKPRQ
jgi:hypothetical protein